MIEIFVPKLLKKEAFEQNENPTILQIVISLLVSLLAVYFSWTCNSAIEVGILLKVVYSMFAFAFGPLYFVYYILVRQETCELAIKNLKV